MTEWFSCKEKIPYRSSEYPEEFSINVLCWSVDGLGYPIYSIGYFQIDECAFTSKECPTPLTDEQILKNGFGEWHVIDDLFWTPRFWCYLPEGPNLKTPILNCS